ncbi:hypothetical protein LTR22_028377, partial [Elasticomyces elasticus]
VFVHVTGGSESLLYPGLNIIGGVHPSAFSDRIPIPMPLSPMSALDDAVDAARLSIDMIMDANDSIGIALVIDMDMDADDWIDAVGSIGMASVVVAQSSIQLATLEPMFIEPDALEAISVDVEESRPSPGPAMRTLSGRH